MKCRVMLGVLGLTTLASVQVLAEGQGFSQQKVARQPMFTATNNTNSAANVVAPGDVTNVKPIQLGKKLGLSGSRTHINGFVSAGVTHITSSIPYNITEHGAVKNTMDFSALSLVGLQVGADLSDSLAVAAQLVSNGDDTNGNTAYSVNTDYAYMRYKVDSNLQLRAGRIRIPTFLYSETLEVGYSYPWVFLPNEVYRIVPFNNLNGVDMLYKQSLGDSGWYYSFQPYAGANKSKFDLYTGGANALLGTTADFDEDSLYGAVASMGNSNITFRGTYAHLKLTGKIPGSAASLVSDQSDYYYAGGMKLDYDGLVSAVEYAHRSTPAPLTTLTGYYAMLGYRIHNVLPNFTYAHINTTNTTALARGGELPQDQKSYTLGVAYYATGNFMVKGGVSDIKPLDGTRGLFDTVTPANLKKNIYQYSVSVNAVF